MAYKRKTLRRKSLRRKSLKKTKGGSKCGGNKYMNAEVINGGGNFLKKLMN